MTMPSPEGESPWRSLWSLPADVVYLNHGSFGPSPEPVQQSYERWTRLLEQQPMNFFLREMEPALEEAVSALAKFIGTSRGNLVFVDNATSGMNIVAASTSLNAGDEVLINDHEYGAVTRLWRRICQQTGARLVTCRLPDQLDDRGAIVNELFSAVTPSTRLIVVSHVTSPTALVLPVEEICRRAKEWEIPVCIDGPHAVGMLPLNLRRLDCDFYTASCHKWLSAPFGSGFLYVSPRQQRRVQPAIVSWGGSIGGRQPSWKDEFNWLGTRNPAAFLATVDAIRFLQSSVSAHIQSTDLSSEPASQLSVLDEFRSGSQLMIRHAITELGQAVGATPIAEDSTLRSDSMISLVVPDGLCPQSDDSGTAGHRHPLQDWLWKNHKIEIPIISWNDRLLIRVSAYLYNSPGEITKLSDCLRDFNQ